MRMHRPSRRVLLSLLAASALAGAAQAAAPARAVPPPARPDASARAEAPHGVAAPIADAITVAGRTGWALMDLETGELLEARLPEEAFPPASTAKVFTALYALETLGPDHRFETRLVASAPLAEGRVDGDVALVGGGDPELDTDALAALAAKAEERGLREVTGRYLVQADLWPETARIDPEQPDEEPYNPAVSSLNLDFNRVLFSWEREKAGDYALTLEARGLRESAPPRRVSIALADSARGVFQYAQADGMEAWSVIPRALGRGGKRWLPVRHPSMHAADVFRSLAARRGALLPEAEPGRAPEDAAPLARLRSRPLEEILRDMLRYSTNLTAEVTGLAATRARGEDPSRLDASGAAMSAWALARMAPEAEPQPESQPATLRAEAAERLAPPADAPALSAGIAATMLSRMAPALTAAAAAPAPRPTPDIDLKNHSGLTPDSRVSPHAMTLFLRAAELRGGGRAGAGMLAGLLKEVRLAPRRGEAAVPDGAAAVAKTGTLYFVRGLAGYITAGSGRRLAFAIYSEDLARRDRLGIARAERASRGWLSRARELERRVVRAWASAY